MVILDIFAAGGNLSPAAIGGETSEFFEFLRRRHVRL
jgi:hypothetical protein